MSTAVPFELFKSRLSELGYTRIYQEATNCVVYTHNGVKCEIKKRHYTFGWLRTLDEIESIKETILSQGFQLSGRHRSENCVNILFATGQDVLETFLTLVAACESIATITARERGIAQRVFPKTIAEREIFLKIAKRYRHALDNEDQGMLDLARDLLEGDSIDHIITLGSSTLQTADETYREHVVPCVCIHNRIIELLQAQTSLTETANFVKTHLAIVLVHPKEAERMDVTLGLRTCMPSGWQWGDSIFARLTQAAITLK